MTYLVFIGAYDGIDDPDPDWVHVRERGLSWEAARDLMAKHLRIYEDDTCPACRANAMEALGRLLVAAPGPFEADVEGDDYIIRPEP